MSNSCKATAGSYVCWACKAPAERNRCHDRQGLPPLPTLLGLMISSRTARTAKDNSCAYWSEHPDAKPLHMFIHFLPPSSWSPFARGPFFAVLQVTAVVPWEKKIHITYTLGKTCDILWVWIERIFTKYSSTIQSCSCFVHLYFFTKVLAILTQCKLN